MNEPIRYFVTEGAGETVVHPLGVAMLLICGLLFLTLPRRYALWPYIAMVCFVSSRQCVAIDTFNLYFTRLFALLLLPLRVLMRGELRGFRLNALDWSVIAYGLVYFVAGAINWGLNPDEMKTRSGYVVDILGSYFILRLLIRDVEDVRSVIRCLAMVSIPLLAFFAVEYVTGHNLFSVFGGVPEITAVREGRLRCQGAFGHPILAGTVCASFVPFYVYGFAKMPRYKWLMVAAIIASLGIVVLCASSTPLMGVVCAFAGLCLYPWRRYTRQALAGVAVLLVCLHITMQAPVWALISRINLTSGNSGYHRYEIVNGFIQHWAEWWLLGSTIGTAHWGWFTFDIADHFVAVGVNAGIVGLGAFITVIVVAFGGSGRVGRRAPFLGWVLGVAIAVHCVCFFGISIWGQQHFAWSLPVAVIGALAYAPSGPARRQRAEAAARRSPDCVLAAAPEPVFPCEGGCSESKSRSV